MTRPRKRLPRLQHLLSEHIAHRGAVPDGPAALVDQFGRSHAVGDGTCIGREPGDGGLAVVESSVSRRHAEVRRSGDGWYLADCDSTNGTFVDGRRVRDEARALGDGSVVVLGDVGFLFYRDAGGVDAARDTADIRATAVSASSTLDGTLRLSEPGGGGGGLLRWEGRDLQLGAAQFALLRSLASRRRGEAALGADVRGFVRSSELVDELPWNTPYPTDNHLKQLVRRTRRALEGLGLVDVIESRQGFGYRLLIDAET